MKLSRSDDIPGNTLQYLLLTEMFLLTSAACSPKKNSPDVLKRHGWVSDYAEQLQPAGKIRISTALEADEKETCCQIFHACHPIFCRGEYG